MREDVRRGMFPPVLFSGALFLLTGCSNSSTPTAAPRGQPPAVPVTAALSVRKDVPVQLRAIGTAEAFSTVSVKTMVNGQIVDEVRNR